jgi:hypothetical protein
MTISPAPLLHVLLAEGAERAGIIAAFRTAGGLGG